MSSSDLTSRRERKDKANKYEKGSLTPKKEGWPAEEGSTDGPANPDDWTHFDISRVLRTLRMANASQARLTLRKLHIRWWHASAKAMKNLLGCAGVPDSVLDLIPPIVETCGPCRDWAKPQPETWPVSTSPTHLMLSLRLI